MIKKIKKTIFLLLAFLIFQPQAYAASVSIWASTTNVTIGDKVTISVNTKDVGGVFNIVSANNAVLSGGVSGEWLDENKTYTYTFTAKEIGSTTISIIPINASTSEVGKEEEYTTSKSVTLNVVAKKTSSSGSSSSSKNPSSGGTTANKKEYSKDNTLKSLSIEDYDLEPCFNKDVLEYSLKVDQSVEKIKISATTNDSKASIKGTGEINLSSGENTIEVKVTAENGNEKVYKIIVTVEDLNPIKVNIDDKEFTIVKKNNDLIEKLEYYEEVYININGQETVAYENATTKTTLVLLKDVNGDIKYYIYNKKENTYEEYNFIKVGGVTLRLLDNNKNPKNYIKQTLELQNKKIDYYKIKKSHKVGLIYGMNVKTGNTGYYVYDPEEETLSKYYDEEIKIYEENLKKQKDYTILTIGIIAVVVVILLILSIVINKNKKKKKYKIK